MRCIYVHTYIHTHTYKHTHTHTHLELVVLDKLVQVDAQEFESYAHVVPEIEIVAHIDNGGCPVGIVVSEVFEQLDLHQRLVVEAFFISDDLESHNLFRVSAWLGISSSSVELNG